MCDPLTSFFRFACFCRCSCYERTETWGRDRLRVTSSWSLEVRLPEIAEEEFSLRKKGWIKLATSRCFLEILFLSPLRRRLWTVAFPLPNLTAEIMNRLPVPFNFTTSSHQKPEKLYWKGCTQTLTLCWLSITQTKRVDSKARKKTDRKQNSLFQVCKCEGRKEIRLRFGVQKLLLLIFVLFYSFF